MGLKWKKTGQRINFDDEIQSYEDNVFNIDCHIFDPYISNGSVYNTIAISNNIINKQIL